MKLLYKMSIPEKRCKWRCIHS